MSALITRPSLNTRHEEHTSFGDRSGHSTSITSGTRVQGAIVRSGTSRFVVLDSHGLPSDRDPRAAVLTSVFAGTSPADGLGGEHYQLNKLAVIESAGNPHSFTFRFYQFNPDLGTFQADMECGHAAAGAGLFAWLAGRATPDQHRRLRAVNAGTSQKIELIVPEDPMESDWKVRFLRDSGPVARLLTADGPRWFQAGEGISVPLHILDRGNIFGLAEADPACGPVLAQSLAAEAAKIAVDSGVDAGRACLVKVLIHRAARSESGRLAFDVVCHCNGQVHKSLPGSGAMALAAFLAEDHLYRVRLPDASGRLAFDLNHPSGTMRVAILWARQDRGYHIVASEFVAPVRLLFHGFYPVPRRCLSDDPVARGPAPHSLN